MGGRRAKIRLTGLAVYFDTGGENNSRSASKPRQYGSHRCGPEVFFWEIWPD